MRWLDDVEKGVWEVKIKRWRQKTVDREEWASLIKDAKAVSQRPVEPKSE